MVTLGLQGVGNVVGRSLSTLEPYHIEALTSVEAAPISTEWLSDPALLLAHIQQAEAFTLIRSNKRVEEMLLKLLVWRSKRFGRAVEQGHLTEMRLTHQDLAELLGTTRVTITHALMLSNCLSSRAYQRLQQHLTLLQAEEFWHYEI